MDSGSAEPHSQPEAIVTPQVVHEPRRAPAKPRRRSRALVWLLALGLAVSLLVNLAFMASRVDLAGLSGSPLEEHYHSLSKWGGDKVAIIQVSGAILDGDGFVKQQIDRVRNDDGVKAVVVRINSPGGTVTGSDYILHHLQEMVAERGIPVVVSMGSIAASGGYYVAMAAGDEDDVIFAEPTTWTGSIGVIIPHYSIAGLLDEWKVEDDSIKSHPLKGIGSITTPMSEQERGILQSLVDDSFSRFKDVVRSGRPEFREHPERLDAIATGQVFTTHQAVENGLVDREGFLEDAVDRALELAGLDRDNTKVVDYRMPRGLFDTMMFGPQASAAPLDLARLLDLSAPRAYYLWTWLPPLTQNSAQRAF